MKIRELLFSGDLTFYASVTVAAVLPLYGYYLPPFMILWGVLWLMEHKLRFSKEMFSDRKTIILMMLFLVFYVWQITGLIYSDSLSSGFERIVKRLSFLLFPLVLFYPGGKVISNIKLITRIFALCTLLYLLYCFSMALDKSLTVNNGEMIFYPHPADYDYENFFTGFHFSGNIHPSYLSMYVLISVIISLESFFDTAVRKSFRYLWILVSVLLLVTMYLLSARAGILAAIITIPLYLVIRTYGRYSKWLILTLATGLIITLAVFFATNEKVKFYFDRSSGNNLREMLENDIRYSIWKSATGVIAKNPVIGVGTGDASEALRREFITRGYFYGYYDNLNAHNQFLEVQVENGIIGLLIFLGILGFMVHIALADKNLVYGMFILMMLIYFFFETILNRLSGITFFALFSFLLIHLRKPMK